MILSNVQSARWGMVLLAAWLTPAWANAGETRKVAAEFQEKLAEIESPDAALTQEGSVNFAPREARFIRVAIQATSNNQHPCIDEIEIFGPDGKENLALAARGAVASASSVIAGFPIHQIDHLNDGRYGNDRSWIAVSNNSEWAQIELPQPATIARVVVTRDRTGKFRDRAVEVFEVLVSLDGQQWQTAAKHEQTPARRPRRLPFFPVDRLPEKSWEGLVDYAFLRERETCRQIPADDHLSPLRVDRPATPGGAPYWGRIARLEPLERVLTLFDELIERMAALGLDVAAERAEAAEFRKQAAANPQSEPLYLAARRAKRQLFFRDPALAPLECILFAKRHPLLPSHNYSEHLDGIFAPGGGVFVLRIPRDDQDRLRPDLAQIERLFDGGEGIVRDTVSDYDANTVYFAYRPDKPEVEGWASYWHLYSMRADGAGLRKLTEGPYHDFDPVCLPDGGLAFQTTRCEVRFLCWVPQAYVLYRMEPDGTHKRRLSYANLSEWRPSVMRDGRILWTRSEYLDKGADFGHTLWAIRPDGTHPELVFGNNTLNCYTQAHEVPGTDEIVCTLVSHGDLQGPVALLDRTKGISSPEAITNITPDTRPHYQMSRSHQNSFRDPYPISRDHFVVSHNPDDQHSWGLYVIDRYGNRELLYIDPEISSKCPSPLRPRPRPPALASVLNADLAKRGLGQFTLQDVYVGLEPAVERGRAKYLRVAEEVPPTLEKLPCGQPRAVHEPFTDFYATPIHKVHGPAGWPSYVAKASLGTVPIAEDGSASFLAPAGKVLYFQLLDADFNELQRMRSVVQLQPGERRGCIGCHENRHLSPSPHAGMALLKPPRMLDRPPWGAKAFDYRKVVQPVLDAHCARCHDGRATAKPNLLGALDEHRVPASYRSLIEGGWVDYFDWTYGRKHFKAEPLSFGTLKSRLWTVLADKNHAEISLGEPDKRAIKAWVDLNCPLWPDYIFRPDRPATTIQQ